VEQFDDRCFHSLPGSGFNIYGGGTTYVATPDAIWKIENNGTDGDDWSRNNYRTGGAGAVATKFPFDENIARAVLSIPGGKYK
jgi:hypothetical protein